MRFSRLALFAFSRGLLEGSSSAEGVALIESSSAGGAVGSSGNDGTVGSSGADGAVDSDDGVDGP